MGGFRLLAQAETVYHKKGSINLTRNEEEGRKYSAGEKRPAAEAYPVLLLVIMMTPMQTRMVPAQRKGVTTSPRKYWDRKATST